VLNKSNYLVIPKRYYSFAANSNIMTTVKNYLSLIKFSHTIFAMPFAMVGFFLGTRFGGHPLSWRLLLLVVLCMVFARSAAMAFNRYLDRDIDEKNPRTAVREIPSGMINAQNALIFVLLNCLGLVITTYFINPLCFALSPVALLVVLGYSFTKRFTSLCHLVLGLGLSLAPIGAFLAVTGYWHIVPVLFSCVVLLWVGGFDIIYALQDEHFDRSQQLNSIPVALGGKNALRLSTLMHLISAAILIYAVYLSHLQIEDFNWVVWLGTACFICLLVYQHTLVKYDDLSKVDMAFFTTNGIASLIFGALFIVDLYFI
jgi:4-hydroxybenzoate polyprenyltransferase